MCQYNLGSNAILSPTGNKIFFLEIKMKFVEKSWNTKTFLFSNYLKYYIQTNIFNIFGNKYVMSCK